MKFSVIIPIYNVEQYLPKCLESLQQQTYRDFEVVCVDDGSSDSSAAIAEEWKEKFDNPFVVIRQENQGTSVARNTGIKAAQGGYLLFLDADDWLVPTALETLAAHLEDEDMLCFGGQRYFEERDEYETPDSIAEGCWDSGWEYYNKYALKHWQFAFVCVVLRVYRRQFILDNNLLFDKEITHEDNLWVPLVCYHAQQTRMINSVLYIYRIRENSKMQEVSVERKGDMIKVANKLATYFKDKPCNKKVLFQALTHHYQISFTQSSKAEDRQLLPLVDWKLYRMVSRTKRRHRIQYAAMRISPVLFRRINKM